MDKKILNKRKHKILITISPKEFIDKWKEKIDVRNMIKSVDWIKISMYPNLSTEFIVEFSWALVWPYVYKYQNLSNEILEKTYYDINKWKYVSKYQRLSENFILKYKDKLKLDLIWTNQYYTEKLIKDLFDYVDWNIVSYTVKITDPELLEYVNKNNNWLYLSNDLRTKLISKSYNIVTIENERFVECYKSVRSDYSSIYAPHVRYDKMHYWYETACDYNYNNYNSFGFGGWTYEDAKNFAQNKKIEGFKILKILIPFESCCWTGNFNLDKGFSSVSFSSILIKPPYQYGEKIRCSKFKIINSDLPVVKKSRFLI